MWTWYVSLYATSFQSCGVLFFCLGLIQVDVVTGWVCGTWGLGAFEELSLSALWYAVDFTCCFILFMGGVVAVPAWLCSVWGVLFFCEVPSFLFGSSAGLSRSAQVLSTPTQDLDLTVSTDGEDLFVFLSDVLEFGYQDLLFLSDLCGEACLGVALGLLGSSVAARLLATQRLK